MSQKISLPIDLTQAGVFDTDSNRVYVAGKSSILLQNVGDLDGHAKMEVLPGYSVVLADPLEANYTTGTVTVGDSDTTVVTGSGTSFLSNAFPGDIFVVTSGTHNTAYQVKEVWSDTKLILRSQYGGAYATGTSYKIIHKVWMMHQFFSSAGSVDNESLRVFDNVTDCSSGTFVNTDEVISKSTTSDSSLLYAGVGLAPSYHDYVTAGAAGMTTISTLYFYKSGATAWRRSKFAWRFQLSNSRSVEGIWLSPYADYDHATTPATNPKTMGFKVMLYTDSASLPNTLVTGATTGDITFTSQEAQTYPFTFFRFTGGTISLSASTNYWVVIEKTTVGWDNPQSDPNNQSVGFWGVASSSSVVTSGLTVNLAKQYDINTGSWSTQTRYPVFAFMAYPTSGTNTYDTSSFDMGFTPTQNGTLTISKLSNVWEPTTYAAGDGYVWTSFSPKYLENAQQGSGETWRWKIYGSANGSSWTDILGGVTYSTLTSYTISNLYRYYYISFDLDSDSSLYGVSTPGVYSISIKFPTGASEITEGSYWGVVGQAKKVFKQIGSGASTASTTENPTGSASWVQYQRDLFWTTGGGLIRYWDGLSTSAANLDDRSASGVNPRIRADQLTLHNDRLFLYKNVAGSTTYSGTSSALDDDELTSTGFPASPGLLGWRCYPDVTNWPWKWWPITSHSTTVLTCSGAKMNSLFGTNSPAVSGDTYLVLKNYRKAAWYSSEQNPSDYPTGQVQYFGDESGDLIYKAISWKGRIFFLCANEIWRMTGYGPGSPWEKERTLVEYGTRSSDSVIPAGDSILYWDGPTIFSYGGGYSTPEQLSRPFTSFLEDLNFDRIDDINSISLNNQVIWSYPSSDSNINNRLIIYDHTTNRWSTRNFGWYTPSRFLISNKEYVYFWEPTTGKICRYPDGYSLAGSDQEISWKTSFVTPSDPIKRAQALFVKAVIQADSSVTINVGYAKDYASSYTTIGTLTPIDSATTGRVDVGPNDTLYECRFPAGAIGSSFSLELSFSTSSYVSILSLEIVADAVESETYQ